MARGDSHSSQELARNKWFRYVAVSPKFQQSNYLRHVSDGTQHQKRDTFGFASNLPATIAARPSRQANIENNQPWLGGAKSVEGGRARTRNDDTITGWL